MSLNFLFCILSCPVSFFLVISFFSYVIVFFGHSIPALPSLTLELQHCASVVLVVFLKITTCTTTLTRCNIDVLLPFSLPMQEYQDVFTLSLLNLYVNVCHAFKLSIFVNPEVIIICCFLQSVFFIFTHIFMSYFVLHSLLCL